MQGFRRIRGTKQSEGGEAKECEDKTELPEGKIEIEQKVGDSIKLFFHTLFLPVMILIFLIYLDIRNDVITPIIGFFWPTHVHVRPYLPAMSASVDEPRPKQNSFGPS